MSNFVEQIEKGRVLNFIPDFLREIFVPRLKRLTVQQLALGKEK